MFQPGDFVRRTTDRRVVKETGAIGWAAFKCTEKDREGGGLSITKADDSMVADRCEQYREHHIRGLKKPAIAFVTLAQLQKLGLEPVLCEDEDDPKYGHLHYLIPCSDKAKLVTLASFASQNQLLQPYFDSEKQQTRPSKWPELAR